MIRLHGPRWYVRPAEVREARATALPGSRWLWFRSGPFGATVSKAGWWHIPTKQRWCVHR